ncbi:flagellar assembly protein [Treponema primitia ZAS-2]|uniref:Flagellar assembly protein FliH n=1 Tax=Treponema primitia (strain ATCC BAA-887 / DSM 12427 / ZAS-2) TaxID=545694 RepID=F5YGM2_TREPZ|nr:flagellar assembly protein FliH [Treponema primitia]AEF85515.1 flagellar assembly protein [Treponema primitia ZAS-2]
MITKAVFRPGELVMVDQKVFLEPPQAYAELPSFSSPALEPLDELEEMPEFLGPTADDLRREAELFKSNWDAEREAMIAEAKDKAEAIVADAQANAGEETLRAAEEAQELKTRAEAEAETLLAEAKQKAEELENSAQTTFEKDRKEAVDAGTKEGREAGYAEGKAEADRLIERVQTVLERAQGRREEILEETEQQIIDLVLILTRKVIKILSETQKDVVKANVSEALSKVKGRGDIIIRVNMTDVKLTTEHINSFITKMEGVKGIQVAEDSTVGPGGCIIETDFGEIDARISSQLSELESKILNMTPIKTKPKSPAGPSVSGGQTSGRGLGALSEQAETADSEAAE